MQSDTYFLLFIIVFKKIKPDIFVLPELRIA